MIKTLGNTIFVSNKSERLQQKSPLKMTKKNVYFVLKAFFVLKIFKFLSRHFGHVEKKSLIRKIRLTSKFITWQPGLQTIPIHIWLNISESKGNQTMKFGQLIEHSKGNNFLQKLSEKRGRVTSSRHLFIF